MVVSDVAFVVPLKRFDLAKERLRVGGAYDVTELARILAERVIASCSPRHVIVLSESIEVARFASEHGAESWTSDATSLNEAVQGAYCAFAKRFDRLVVIHGDLREPAGLGEFEPEDGVTIVTDHHGTGTNVLVVPTNLDFHFTYGDDSAHLHRLEAERLDLPCHTVTDSLWRFDVDEPSDLK